MFSQAFCRKHPDLLRSRENPVLSGFTYCKTYEGLCNKKVLEQKILKKLLTSRVSFFKCFLISEDVPSSPSDLTSFLAFLDSSSNLTFLTSLSSFSVDAGRFKAPPFLKKNEFLFFKVKNSKT